MSTSTVESSGSRLPPRAERARRRSRRRIVVWFGTSALLAGSLAIPLAIRAIREGRGFLVSGLIVVAAAWLVHRAWLAIADVRGDESLPARYWERASGCLPIAIGITGLLALSATLLGAGLLVSDDDLSIPEGAGVISAFFFLLLVINAVTRESFHVRVYPYFESRVGDIQTYAKGDHVARHMGELDELAVSIGVVPPSTFGWNDDFAGEPLVWHPSAEGLRTVKALLGALEKEDFARPDHAAIIEDLKRIAHALDWAQSRGIRFCLILRIGDGTNAIEHERRKGTFF